jgi:hypothetical protein
MDPAIHAPAVTVGWKLARRKMGFRTLLDVIPLDASLVKGSHGRPGSGEHGPIVMSRQKHLIPASPVASVDVYSVILAHLGVSHAR